MLTFDKAFDSLLNKADALAVDVAKTALRFTAADVRQTARRSIKSGGKNKRSKKWEYSKPGEPPRSHIGTLKNAIQYEASADGLSYMIGPERRGASDTLKTLEYGGQGAFREVDYNADYVAKKRRRKRSARSFNKEMRCRVHGTVRASRPKAKRPYYIYSKELGRGQLVRDYRYFYSEEEWRAATKSPAFQAWANAQRRLTVSHVHIDARPYMRPALAAQTTETKNALRMTRAARSVAAKSDPVPY